MIPGAIHSCRIRSAYIPVAAFGLCVGSRRGGQQPAETVQVRCRTQMKLDPVSPRWITPDGGISTEAFPDLRPSGPRDPQVDHAGRFQMGDFSAGGEQGRLIAIVRSPFCDWARREHGDDEGPPKYVAVVITHCSEDKRNGWNLLHLFTLLTR
jgi:hypothetical protein